MATEEGIYYAHQPIYGFRRGYSEPGLLLRYIHSYQIIKTLSHLEFNSLLDVGCSEGYKGALARHLLGVEARNSDLSPEACKLSKKIFNVDADPADMHDLPYSNEQFDVVTCSESLEHVTDYKKAVRELLRVAKKAVLITVPHDPLEEVQKNIELTEKGEAHHAHIHHFDNGHFDYLKKEGYQIYEKRMFIYYSKPLFLTIDAQQRDYKENSYPALVFRVHNFLVPFYRKIFGIRTASLMLKVDEFLSRSSKNFRNIIFFILKNGTTLRPKPFRSITPKQIIDFTVPYYYMNGSK